MIDIDFNEIQNAPCDICTSDTLEYYLRGLDNLTQLLRVVGEIAAETGMQDWIITHRGHRLQYNWKDAKMVAAGAMSETEYIAHNTISLPDK